MPGAHRRLPLSREEESLRLELTRVRESKGQSQRGLSVAVGLHPMTVGKIERGERSVSVADLVKLCRALGVSPLEVLKSALDGG